NVKIFITCLLWYSISSITSQSTKSILNKFPFPSFLSIFQFLTSIFLTLLIVFINKKLNNALLLVLPKGFLPKDFNINYLKNRQLISKILPMGISQFIGKFFSHLSTTLISIAMVSSIKTLSPFLMVLSYRLYYKVKFPIQTYLTLFPLVLGVIIMVLFDNISSISKSSSNNTLNRLLYSFISTLIFVVQNMYGKKVVTYTSSKINNNPADIKIDKLTVLFFCSLFGLIFSLPLFLFSELPILLSSSTNLELKSNTSFIPFKLLVLNGCSHFFQALLAFQLLGSISTVSYSIASMLKRIVIITVSILISGKLISNSQILGIILIGIGLYSYDRWG
ncbi:TPT-domain-containing protein, partial [Ascoidea rubescens DSM 1968]